MCSKNLALSFGMVCFLTTERERERERERELETDRDRDTYIERERINHASLPLPPHTTHVCMICDTMCGPYMI